MRFIKVISTKYFAIFQCPITSWNSDSWISPFSIGQIQFGVPYALFVMLYNECLQFKTDYNY